MPLGPWPCTPVSPPSVSCRFAALSLRLARVFAHEVTGSLSENLNPNMAIPVLPSTGLYPRFSLVEQPITLFFFTFNFRFRTGSPPRVVRTALDLLARA